MRSPGTLRTNFHGPLPMGFLRNASTPNGLDVLLGHQLPFLEHRPAQAFREIGLDLLGVDTYRAVVHHLNALDIPTQRRGLRRDRFWGHRALEAELHVVR